LLGQKEGGAETIVRYPDFPETVGTVPKIRKIGETAPKNKFEDKG
jgi:hypothetical protein